jgi:threonylcarbamoyladenosine tRNA methylthiotransferase MtaB
MARGLEAIGYRIIDDLATADLCVINTCTVTQQSDAKCRKKIRSIRRANPNALIAVVGCFSQISSRQILDIGGVDLILGNEEKLNLHRYIDEVHRSDGPVVRVAALSEDPFVIETVGQHLDSTRANLKVQDGCDFHCAFCIIPTARGRSRPRQPDNIREEVRSLAAMGVREIVLTGVNIGTYRYGDVKLLDLLSIFDDEPGIRRVRISSIEPTTVGPELFERMKPGNGKLVPFLHLPLQSASDEMLERMRRRYRFAEYRDFVLQAKAEVPDLCLGSDVMVGFPGESEALFAVTLNALDELPLTYFHVFPFAERPGTVAAGMRSERVADDAIVRRAAVLRQLSAEKRDWFVRQYRGRVVPVLFESVTEGDLWRGFSDNYIRVSVRSDEHLRNRILPVRIETAVSGCAFGVIETAAG